jgi:tRNA(Ile2) C34 agmatinyltransferase TiaS
MSPERPRDLLADVVEPHCPSCGTVLHWHPRGWWCRGCDIEWAEGLVQYGE